MGVLGALILGGGWIVLFDSPRQIVRGAYVEPACGILKHIYPKWTTHNFHNSPSRTRTYNLAVNSRSLYQLSYRGIAKTLIHRFPQPMCPFCNIIFVYAALSNTVFNNFI